MTSGVIHSSVHELDLKYLACPLPVLKTKKFIKTLKPEDLLVIISTDPSSTADFKTFCEVTGHALETSSECDGTYVFHIRVKK